MAIFGDEEEAHQRRMRRLEEQQRRAQERILRDSIRESRNRGSFGDNLGNFNALFARRAVGLDAGLRGLTDSLVDATDALSGARGGNDKSNQELKQTITNFGRMLAFTSGPLAMFGGAVALAATAIQTYHERLNLTRDAGGGTTLSKELQNMTVDLVMDTEQIKALSDSMGQTFGLSLTNNQREVERLALKNQLDERKMGKEYAEEAKNSMAEFRDSFADATTPTKLLNKLSASTSVLAKTLGISNKIALDQIKAIDKNTKTIAGEDDASVKEAIAATLQETTARLSGMGITDTAAQERIRAKAAENLSKDKISETVARATKLSRDDTKGGEVFRKELEAAGFTDVSQYTELLYRRINGAVLSAEETAKISRVAVSQTAAEGIGIADRLDKARDARARGDKKEEAHQNNQIITDTHMGAYQDTATHQAQKGKTAEQIIEGANIGGQSYGINKKGEENSANLEKIMAGLGVRSLEDKEAFFKKLAEDKNEADKMGVDQKAFKENKTQKMREILSAHGEKDVSSKSADEIESIYNNRKDIKASEREKVTTSALQASFDNTKLETLIEEGNTKGLNIAGKTVNAKDFKEKTSDENLAKNTLTGAQTEYETAARTAEQMIKKTLTSFENGVMELLNKGIGPLNDMLQNVNSNFTSLAGAFKLAAVAAIAFLGGKALLSMAAGIAKFTILPLLKPILGLLRMIPGAGMLGNVMGGGAGLLAKAVGTVGPLALVAGAIGGVTGALDGWSKSDAWFENTEQMKKNTELLKTQTDAGLAYAKSISDTGTAFWDGTKYIDGAGKAIAAQAEKATFLQKISSSLGQAISTVTFGSFDGKKIAHGINDGIMEAQAFVDKNGFAGSLKIIGEKVWDETKGFSDSIGLTSLLKGDFNIAKSNFVTSVKDFGSTLSDKFGNFFGSVKAHMPKWFTDMTTEFSNSEIGKELGKSVDAFSNWFKTDAMKDVGEAFDSFTNWAGGIATELKPQFEEFGKGIRDSIPKILPMLKSLAEFGGEIFSTTVVPALRLLADGIAYITPKILPMLQDLGKWAEDHLIPMFKRVAKWGEGLFELIKSPFEGEGGAVMDTTISLLKSLGTAITWVVDNIEAVLVVMAGLKIAMLAETAARKISAVAGGVGGAIGNAGRKLGSLGSGIATVGGAVGRGTVSAGKAVGHGVVAAAPYVAPIISGAASSVASGVSTVGSKIGAMSTKGKAGLALGAGAALYGMFRSGDAKADETPYDPNAPDKKEEKSFGAKAMDFATQFGDIGLMLLPMITPMLAPIGTAITGALATAGAALLPILTPILLPLAGVAAVIAAGYAMFKGWNNASEDFADTLKEKDKLLQSESPEAQAYAESIAENGKAFWDGKQYVDEYGKAIKAQPSTLQKFSSAISGLTLGWADPKNIAKNLEGFGTTIKDWGNKITTLASDIWTGVTDYFSKLKDSLMGIMGGFWEVITSPFTAIKQWLSGELTFSEAMAQAWESIKGGFGRIFASLGDIFSTILGPSLTAHFTKIKDDLMQIFGGYLDVFTAPFNALKGWISGELSFTDAMNVAWDGIKLGLSKILSGMTSLVVDGFTFIKDKVVGAISSIPGLGFLGNDKEKEKPVENKTDGEKPWYLKPMWGDDKDKNAEKLNKDANKRNKDENRRNKEANKDEKSTTDKALDLVNPIGTANAADSSTTGLQLAPEIVAQMKANNIVPPQATAAVGTPISTANLSEKQKLEQALLNKDLKNKTDERNQTMVDGVLTSTEEVKSTLEKATDEHKETLKKNTEAIKLDLKNNNESINNSVGEAMKKVTTTVDSSMEKVDTTFDAGIRSMAGSFGSWVSNAVGSVTDTIANSSVGKAVGEVGSSIANSSVGKAVGEGWETVKEGAREFIANVSGSQEKMMSSTFKAFTNAGFSENQAKALTAEVGRENGYNESTVFGNHTDAANGATNTGFFSWQGSRSKELQKRLAEKGLMKDGKMIHSQESLNEMAKFAKEEMESGQYKGLGNFLQNKDVDSETAAKQLGTGYIKWAYGQDHIGHGANRKEFDWHKHDKKRAGYYNKMESMIASNKIDKSPDQSSMLAKTANLLNPIKTASADSMITGSIPPLAPGLQPIQKDGDYYLGDSISDGYKVASGGVGDTVVGRNPKKILESIKTNLVKDINFYKGKNVHLSTGLSNNVTDLKSIEEQMKLLKEAGAITDVYGVANDFKGSTEDGAKMNKTLQELSEKYGMHFKGGFESSKDKVHPKEYSKDSLKDSEAKKALQRGLQESNSQSTLNSTVSTTPVSLGGIPTSGIKAVPLSELRIKSSESTAGGKALDGTMDLARAVQGEFGDKIASFTAFNDAYHQKNSPSSGHTKGLKFDVTLKDSKDAASMKTNIEELAKSIGVQVKVMDEYADPSSKATGGHLDVGFANEKDAALFHALFEGRNQRIDDTGNKVDLAQQVSPQNVMPSTYAPPNIAMGGNDVLSVLQAILATIRQIGGITGPVSTISPTLTLVSMPMPEQPQTPPQATQVANDINAATNQQAVIELEKTANEARLDLEKLYNDNSDAAKENQRKVESETGMKLAEMTGLLKAANDGPLNADDEVKYKKIIKTLTGIYGVTKKTAVEAAKQGADNTNSETSKAVNGAVNVSKIDEQLGDATKSKEAELKFAAEQRKLGNEAVAKQAEEAAAKFDEAIKSFQAKGAKLPPPEFYASKKEKEMVGMNKEYANTMAMVEKLKAELAVREDTGDSEGAEKTRKLLEKWESDAVKYREMGATLPKKDAISSAQKGAEKTTNGISNAVNGSAKKLKEHNIDDRFNEMNDTGALSEARKKHLESQGMNFDELKEITTKKAYGMMLSPEEKEKYNKMNESLKEFDSKNGVLAGADKEKRPLTKEEKRDGYIRNDIAGLKKLAEGFRAEGDEEQASKIEGQIEDLESTLTTEDPAKANADNNVIPMIQQDAKSKVEVPVNQATEKAALGYYLTDDGEGGKSKHDIETGIVSIATKDEIDAYNGNVKYQNVPEKTAEEKAAKLAALNTPEAIAARKADINSPGNAERARQMSGLYKKKDEVSPINGLTSEENKELDNDILRSMGKPVESQNSPTQSLAGMDAIGPMASSKLWGGTETFSSLGNNLDKMFDSISDSFMLDQDDVLDAIAESTKIDSGEVNETIADSMSSGDIASPFKDLFETSSSTPQPSEGPSYYSQSDWGFANAIGGIGTGVSDAVTKIGSSVGSFLGFENGGMTPSSPDPILEQLTGISGAAGVVHANELVVPTNLVGTVSNLASSIGSMPTTSGSVPSMAQNIPMSASGLPLQNTQTNTPQTTTAQKPTPGDSSSKVETLLAQILAENIKHTSMLGVSSREAVTQSRQNAQSYRMSVDRFDNSRQKEVSLSGSSSQI